jgi:hypothetical protein
MAVNVTFGRKALKSPVSLHSEPLECTAAKLKITNCKNYPRNKKGKAQTTERVSRKKIVSKQQQEN